jgi:hypothetical protein
MGQRVHKGYRGPTERKAHKVQPARKALKVLRGHGRHTWILWATCPWANSRNRRLRNRSDAFFSFA